MAFGNFTKRELLDWLVDLTGAEEAYPFTREKSKDTPVIRHRRNQKMLALVTQKRRKTPAQPQTPTRTGRDDDGYQGRYPSLSHE